MANVYDRSSQDVSRRSIVRKHALKKLIAMPHVLHLHDMRDFKEKRV